jgi:hypothetical protein
MFGFQFPQKRTMDGRRRCFTVQRKTVLTAKESADYLRISPFTLRRIERMGLIVPYRTPGGHRRYTLEMLNEYLENSRILPD